MAHALADSASPQSPVVALIDIDCFECQIWCRMYPTYDYWKLPCVVADQTGRISSVSYEARALGITRDHRLRKAKKLAEDANVKLTVFNKPNDREKPDGKTLRYSSWELVDALKEFCQTYTYGVIMEYSSIDEFYLDISQEVSLRMADRSGNGLLVESKTFLEGKYRRIEGDKLKHRINKVYPIDHKLREEERLVVGALIMQELNNFVFSKTKFKASVGIGENKLLAKLACSLNKPNGITVFPISALPRLAKEINISSLPGLGGKLGAQIQEKFGIKTMAELEEIAFEDIEEAGFTVEQAFKAFALSHGRCEDPVIPKERNGEVSSGKNFYGGQLASEELLKYHLTCLCEEMMERLEEEQVRHSRVPKSIKIQVGYTPKAKTDEVQNSSTTFPAGDVNCASSLCDKALPAILSNITGDLTDVTITRLRLTAKGFVKINN